MLKPAKIPSAGIARGEMVEPKPKYSKLLSFLYRGTSFNPGCLSGGGAEHYHAEQTLPRSANDWGAQEWAEEACGGELRQWGLPCMCVWMGLCSSTRFHLGGLCTIDHLLSVGIWGYNEFLW